MSKKSYAIGFCKTAYAHDLDPKGLYRFMIGNEFTKIAQKMPKEFDEAMKEIGQYAKDHPILGGAQLGAASSITGGTAAGSSVGGSVGGLVSAPIAAVAAPVGGSVTASQGDGFAPGSAMTSAAVEAAGKAVGGAIGAIPGSVAGSALAPIGALGGAVGGSSVESGPNCERKKREFERKKREADVHRGIFYGRQDALRSLELLNK